MRAQGGCKTEEPFCVAYRRDLSFDPATCPVDPATPCRPRCLFSSSCLTSPYSDDEPWSHFADGATCVAADGSGGQCFHGECVVGGVCGNGIVEASEVSHATNPLLLSLGIG